MPRIFLGFLLSAFVLAPRAPLAQQQPLHLNPVVAKLAEGKTVYGIQTNDWSLAHARETARAPVDFVYADMEHNPLDLPALHLFLMGMTDRALVLKKGNLQPNVALFARFPPEADQSQWVVKQALDIGLHGIFFNGVDTKEQAVMAVRSMRYPPLKGSKYYEPDRHPRERSGQRALDLGADRRRIRSACRRVAAQSRRGPAGHADD